MRVFIFQIAIMFLLCQLVFQQAHSQVGVKNKYRLGHLETNDGTRYDGLLYFERDSTIIDTLSETRLLKFNVIKLKDKETNEAKYFSANEVKGFQVGRFWGESVFESDSIVFLVFKELGGYKTLFASYDIIEQNIVQPMFSIDIAKDYFLKIDGKLVVRVPNTKISVLDPRYDINDKAKVKELGVIDKLVAIF